MSVPAVAPTSLQINSYVTTYQHMRGQRSMFATAGASISTHQDFQGTVHRVKCEVLRDVHSEITGFVNRQLTSGFGPENDLINLKVSSLVRTLDCARRNQRPAEPKPDNLLEFEINTDFLEEGFYAGDVRVADARLLKRSRKWYLDGFKVVNKPFTQLWGVHAFVQQGKSAKQVPLVYVVMSSRRKQDYVAVLEKILQLLDEAPAVECFTMDFEISLWQALRQLFPTTALWGCSFHWAQDIQRHVQELGLSATYRECGTVHALISKLLALPFLPGQQITRAFTRLRERADTSSKPVADLFKYTNDQWNESSLWSTEEWSVYRQSVRTNNDTERYHKALINKAGHGKLAFYVPIPILHQEAKVVNYTVNLVAQEVIVCIQKAVFRSMDREMFLLWDLYDENELRAEEFLEKVGEIYGQM